MRSIHCLALLAGTFGFTGCGGGTSEPTPATNLASSESESVQKSTETSPVTQNSTIKSNSPVRTDENGRKWLGDVPFDVYEVFFDDPVAVIGDNTSVMIAGTPTGQSPGTASSSKLSSTGGMGSGSATAPASTDSEAAPGVSSAAWADLITTAVLEDETKAIRNELTRIMQSLGTYNREFASVQILGSTLAALGQIGHEHPETFPWKTKALYVRDLAGQVSMSASALGRESYEKALLPFEQIITILDGSAPTGLEEPDAGAAVSNLADREWLMRRMEKSMNVLKSSNQNEPAFKSQKAQGSAELQLLAGLAALLRTPDYVYADEKAYQDFLATMTQASVSGREATDAETFAAFQEHFNKLQQVCNDCHKQYRFE